MNAFLLQNFFLNSVKEEFPHSNFFPYDIFYEADSEGKLKYIGVQENVGLKTENFTST